MSRARKTLSKGEFLYVRVKWTNKAKTLTAALPIGQLSKRLGIVYIQNLINEYSLTYKEIQESDVFFDAVQTAITERLGREGYLG